MVHKGNDEVSLYACRSSSPSYSEASLNRETRHFYYIYNKIYVHATHLILLISGRERNRVFQSELIFLSYSYVYWGISSLLPYGPVKAPWIFKLLSARSTGNFLGLLAPTRLEQLSLKIPGMLNGSQKNLSNQFNSVPQM